MRAGYYYIECGKRTENSRKRPKTTENSRAYDINNIFASCLRNNHFETFSNLSPRQHG